METVVVTALGSGEIATSGKIIATSGTVTKEIAAVIFSEEEAEQLYKGFNIEHIFPKSYLCCFLDHFKK
jgi:hypothetical protein